MHVSGNFECGAIRVHDVSNPRHAKLMLKPDVNPAFKQWFFFRVTGATGGITTLEIIDAGGYDSMKSKEGLDGHPTLWENYAAYASYDCVTWFNVPTRFDGSSLVIDVELERSTIYFATYVPYTHQRQQEAVGRWLKSPGTRLDVLGITPDGRDLDLLTIGEPANGKKSAWITTRQHPSETQGSWCLEGIVDRLLDARDPVAAELRKSTVFYIIPNLNPDGTARGHTRTNSQGVNLNREWANPSIEKSPEVYFALAAMQERGVDFYLDLHAWGGDKPFCIGPYHTPSMDATRERQWRGYMTKLAESDRAFELGQPYPGGGPAPGKADLGMSWNQVGERFGATAMLYELIYKRNAATPDIRTSWSTADCVRFGHNSLEPMLATLAG